ncbi:NAD(P)/FAD-dependent oxidoreductase [Frigoribacterium sp. PhB24]|uniref:phytoene desaturase family protein n=1 Tax=Frigoribacterium sp. PhB24 TaxID=2485204 RepID=UPI000F49EE1D|nr:NAD(P)/FAD-dependent oxidoreductase [Frigoribacterium sp. PhB24]ROS50234.1 phytoene dehydrogenase-like protein [Frigoribacterium sp. PhB24]
MVDAIVVGSGPNGLAAAVTLARAGLSVEVVERAAHPGGSTRTEALTADGFLHDVGSAVHPLALQSPFMSRFEMHKRVDLVVPDVQFAHPLDGGRIGLAYRDLERTAESLGRDGVAYTRLMKPLVDHVDAVAELATGPLLRLPRDMPTSVRMGLRVLEQGSVAWGARFSDDIAPALLTGAAAHGNQPLPSIGAAAVGLALTSYAHAGGWPIPEGGSRVITDALVTDLERHGGTIERGRTVTHWDDVADAKAVLFDTSIPTLLQVAGVRLPWWVRRSLRGFRFGNAVAKVDFALTDPVPWTRSEAGRAGTVHLGGTRAQIAAAERAVARGRSTSSPYVLASQPTVVDPSRAPAGKHVLWSYMHVPAGSVEDPVETITRQVERFAPGFRDVILATHATTATDIASANPDYVGGDVFGGSTHLGQLVRRPMLSPDPWRMGEGIYLCSQSAAPGPGVHGMAGWHAARSALRRTFGLDAEVDLSVGGPSGTERRVAGRRPVDERTRR